MILWKPIIQIIYLESFWNDEKKKEYEKERSLASGNIAEGKIQVQRRGKGEEFQKRTRPREVIGYI
jgi:hypothetical protein